MTRRPAEDYRLQPGDHYQQSKLDGELLARKYFDEGRLPGTVVRPGRHPWTGGYALSQALSLDRERPLRDDRRRRRPLPHDLHRRSRFGLSARRRESRRRWGRFSLSQGPNTRRSLCSWKRSRAASESHRRACASRSYPSMLLPSSAIDCAVRLGYHRRCTHVVSSSSSSIVPFRSTRLSGSWATSLAMGSTKGSRARRSGIAKTGNYRARSSAACGEHPRLGRERPH